VSGGERADTALSILAAAREAPDRPALIAGDRVVRYEELAGSVRSALGWIARRLDATEAARAEPSPLRPAPVALVARRIPETLHLLLALLELGIPAAMIHARLTARERSAMEGLLRPVLTVDPAALDEVEEELSGQPPTAGIDPESILAVVPTSGSSGRPKAVLLSRRAFLASARASAANLGWDEEDRWLAPLPLAHVGGLSIPLRTLIARRCTVLAPPGAFDPAAIVRQIERHRVTLVSLVPPMLEALLSLDPPWRPPPPLRAVLLGGAGASAELLWRAADRGVPVLTTYGLTETCSQVATQRYGTRNRGELGAGPPLEGVALRIMDGEIQVHGAMLLSGLLDRGGVAPGVDAAGWLATGDEGELDGAGRLHVRGRLDRMIVSGGENVDPREVEAALGELPGIAEAVVFGVEDPVWGRVVAAALVAEGEPPADAALRRGMESVLASYKRPRLVGFLPALPVTPAGKVDRAAAEAAARKGLRALPSS
jgi:O-succinylbenzoic acid--CoA ligase